jgi:hypothetical protein
MASHEQRAAPSVRERLCRKEGGIGATAARPVHQCATRRLLARATRNHMGTEVVFPSLNIRRPLPLNHPVVIDFTPRAAGELTFVCGTNMLRGTVVVK